MKTIKRSIDINAPKKKVWSVMLDKHYTKIWYSQFSEGSYADTDWKPGSKALFKDDSESGLVGKVIVNDPNEKVSVEYMGLVIAGREDYESDGAKSVKGGRETYILSEKNGETHLEIECDMSPEYFDAMSSSWERAMIKIKELSEVK
ncbi:MAG: SRPBCC domain-containing protein [Ignavibacteria bacterium]